MKPILSPSDAASLDRALISKYSLSESSLIDSAARCVFEETKELLKGRIVFLIGPGNNGSDGLGMAEIAKEEGLDVSLCYLTEKGNRENLKRRNTDIPVVDDALGFDTAVDALFGFSFHGEADERTREIVSSVNCYTISVDIPSAGIVRADTTVALMCLKSSFYLPSARRYAGNIILRNPGFPESELNHSPGGIYLVEDSDLKKRSFSISDYKNTRGHLLIIGGSDRYSGAVRLSARAAFHSGTGLVSVMTDSEKVRDESPSVMIIKESDNLSSYDAIAIGPGWDTGSREIFEKAICSEKPVVADADALKFIPGMKFSVTGVITPHIGEYRRLMEAIGEDDGLKDSASLASSLRKLSKRINAVVVLKSSVVWIATPDLIYIYDGVNPSLGVAGSGDVLTGIISSLLSSGCDALDSAINGVIIHQMAGKLANEKYGFYSSEDLINEVGKII